MSGLADLITMPERSRKADPWLVFTLEKRTLLLYHLREGSSRKEACGLARLSYGSLNLLLQEGQVALEDHEQYDCPMTPKAEFFTDVMYAEARASKDYGKRLRTYGDPKHGGDARNWAAEFTHRERTQPETYGRKSTVSVQQEQAVRVIFEERGGNEWQGVRHAEPQRQIESGEIVDTAMTEPDEV